MKQRILALGCACCMLLGCTACRIRVDLTEVLEDDPTATATTTQPIPENNDEMATEAWQIYSRALEIGETYTTYEQTYEGRRTVMGETMVTKARFVRVEKDGDVSLLIEREDGTTRSSAYFAGGIGYFNTGEKKYWMPTEEEAVYETLGFSEGEDLAESMFSEAIVIRNDDGSTVVSCPLSGQNGTQFARMHLGEEVMMSAQLRHAEAGVTVDEAGNPLSFVTSISADTMLYGTVSYENESRYVAVGDDVVLTPPTDLDTYSSMIE